LWRRRGGGGWLGDEGTKRAKEQEVKKKERRNDEVNDESKNSERSNPEIHRWISWEDIPPQEGKYFVH